MFFAIESPSFKGIPRGLTLHVAFPGGHKAPTNPNTSQPLSSPTTHGPRAPVTTSPPPPPNRPSREKFLRLAALHLHPSEISLSDPPNGLPTPFDQYTSVVLKYSCRPISDFHWTAQSSNPGRGRPETSTFGRHNIANRPTKPAARHFQPGTNTINQSKFIGITM